MPDVRFWGVVNCKGKRKEERKPVQKSPIQRTTFKAFTKFQRLQSL
jgi:hypothetical protein